MERKDLKAALEAILFSSGGSVTNEKLAEALGESAETIETVLDEMAGKFRYERRGVRIIKLEDSWQMTSSPEYANEVRAVLELRKPPPLSKAALEVLSLIAYYQPVTRAYIEQIRGVDSSSTVGILAERGLVEECGQLEVPGRPHLFRTTGAFLRTFGISSLNELPDIEQIEEDSDQLTIDEEEQQEQSIDSEVIV